MAKSGRRVDGSSQRRGRLRYKQRPGPLEILITAVRIKHFAENFGAKSCRNFIRGRDQVGKYQSIAVWLRPLQERVPVGKQEGTDVDQTLDLMWSLFSGL